MQGNAPRSSEISTDKLCDDLSPDFNSKNIELLFEVAQFSAEELKTNYQLLLNDDNPQNYLLLSLSQSCQQEINLQVRLQMILEYFAENRLAELDLEGQKLLDIKKKIINSISNLYLDFESSIVTIAQSPSKTSTSPSQVTLTQVADDNSLSKDIFSAQLNNNKKIFIRQLIGILSEILSKSEDENFMKKIHKIFDQDIYKDSTEGNALLVIDLKNLCIKKNQQQISKIINSELAKHEESLLQDQATQLKIQQTSQKLIDYLKYEIIFNYIFYHAKERIEDLRKSDLEFKDDAKVYLNFYRLFKLIGKSVKQDFSLNFLKINFRSYECDQKSFKPKDTQIIEFNKIIEASSDNDKFIELISKEIIKEINEEKKSYASEIFNLKNFISLKTNIDEVAMLKADHLMKLGIYGDNMQKIIDDCIYKCQVKMFKDKILTIIQNKDSEELFCDIKKITQEFDLVYQKRIKEPNINKEQGNSLSPALSVAPQQASSSKSVCKKEMS